jgi:hypothetical protein
MYRSGYSVSLCCFVCCWCVNVYCTTVTGCQPNCSSQIYHIISYHIIPYHIKHNRVIVFEKGIHMDHLGSRCNSSGKRTLPLASRDGVSTWLWDRIYTKHVFRKTGSPCYHGYFCVCRLYRLIAVILCVLVIVHPVFLSVILLSVLLQTFGIKDFIAD